MSVLSTTSSNGAYWELVHCHVCYLAYINPENPQAPPSIPFWITECGHVLCNNHLKPDQSCTSCGKTNIGLMPLQRDLPEPLSYYFMSLPHTLERICTAAHSQQEHTLKLVRYYRARCLRYKQLVEKLKGGLVELQNMKEAMAKLEEENRRLRCGERGSIQGSPVQGRNGKRKRDDNDNDGRSSSSHNSALLHLNAPDRLTLPADSINQPPIHALNSSETRNVGLTRPATSLYQEYSYQPQPHPMPRQQLPTYSESMQHPPQPHPINHSMSMRMGPPPPLVRVESRQHAVRAPHMPEGENMDPQWSAFSNDAMNAMGGQMPSRPISTTNTGYMSQRQQAMQRPEIVERPATTRLQAPASVTHYPPQVRAHPGAGNGMQPPTPMLGNTSRQRFQPLQNSSVPNVANDGVNHRQQFGKFRPASIRPASNYPQRFMPRGT